MTTGMECHVTIVLLTTAAVCYGQAPNAQHQRRVHSIPGGMGARLMIPQRLGGMALSSRQLRVTVRRTIGWVATG
jgi:hypothetical protein